MFITRVVAVALVQGTDNSGERGEGFHLSMYVRLTRKGKGQKWLGGHRDERGINILPLFFSMHLHLAAKMRKLVQTKKRGCYVLDKIKRNAEHCVGCY